MRAHDEDQDERGLLRQLEAENDIVRRVAAVDLDSLRKIDSLFASEEELRDAGWWAL